MTYIPTTDHAFTAAAVALLVLYWGGDEKSTNET